MKWDWRKLLSLDTLQEKEEENRTRAQRDFDSIMFTSCFRRLGGKTQVIPLRDDEAIHSRLTHSLEVMSIARSFGFLMQKKLMGTLHEGEWRNMRKEIGDWETTTNDMSAKIALIDLPFTLSAAALLHDAGNPPFGHFGEDTIGCWFRMNYKKISKHIRNPFLGQRRILKDLRSFDGNAHALRIALHGTSYRGSEKGLELAPLTIGAFTKYPFGSSLGNRKKFGFFEQERAAFQETWEKLGLEEKIRHPFSWLSELADDIINPLIDLEDSVERDFVTLEEADNALKGLASLGYPATFLDGFPKSHRIQAMTRAVIRPLIKSGFDDFDRWMSRGGDIRPAIPRHNPVLPLIHLRVTRRRGGSVAPVGSADGRD